MFFPFCCVLCQHDPTMLSSGLRGGQCSLMSEPTTPSFTDGCIHSLLYILMKIWTKNIIFRFITHSHMLTLIFFSSSYVILHSWAFSPCFPSLWMDSWQLHFHWNNQTVLSFYLFKVLNCLHLIYIALKQQAARTKYLLNIHYLLYLLYFWHVTECMDEWFPTKEM